MIFDGRLCCGLEFLRSGSRWSTWFCKPCNAQSRALNELAQQLVVAHGPHTLMNGIGLLEYRAGEQDVARFVSGVKAMAASSEWLHAWGATVLAYNERALELDPDVNVPLDLYLRLTDSEDCGLTRDAAFERMVMALAGRGSA
jgi:hypothetical protein